MSSLGAMSSLVRVYEYLRIPKGDRKQLGTKYGIDTATKLIQSRDQLARSENPSCRLLTAAVGYICECRKKLQPPHDDATVHLLFTSSTSLQGSFVMFLALCIKRAGTPHQRQLTKRDAVTMSNKDAKASMQKIYRDGDVYWEKVQNETSEEDDEATEEDLLGIGGHDSSWKLSPGGRQVLLSAAPQLIRIPITVFRDSFKHQRDGVAWMAGLYQQDKGGILGDEMGMGKTRQASVTILGLMSAGTIRNCLIICPKSVLDAAWMKEITLLIPLFDWKHNQPKVVMLSAGKHSKHQRMQVLKASRHCSEKDPHLVIMAYPQVQNKTIQGFQGGQSGRGLGIFQYVVLDEAHRVKNTKSQIRKNIEKLSKQSAKLLLTGTPILNRLSELHSLLKLCAPEDIMEWPRFRDQFEKPIEASFKPEASEYEIKRGGKLTHELQAHINPFILQRYKRDHLKGLVPANYEFDVWTRLSAAQRQLYSEAIKNVELLLKTFNSKVTFICVLPAINKLMNLCQHPLIFNVAEEPGKYNQAAFQLTLRSFGQEELVAQSPKLVVLMELLHMWCEQGCKILVFSHSIMMLDIIQFVLDNTEGFKACRIDGKTSQIMRARLVTEFNRVGSTFNIMLLSINAGGEGLTLTGANKSVIYDPAWNLAKSDQAVARTSRPGQTRECECIHLLAAGTIEEKIYGKQVYKGRVEGTIFENRAVGNGKLDKDELTKLFVLEKDGVCESFDNSRKTKGSACLEKCSLRLKKNRGILGIAKRVSLS